MGKRSRKKKAKLAAAKEHAKALSDTTSASAANSSNILPALGQRLKTLEEEHQDRIAQLYEEHQGRIAQLENDIKFQDALVELLEGDQNIVELFEKGPNDAVTAEAMKLFLAAMKNLVDDCDEENGDFLVLEKELSDKRKEEADGVISAEELSEFEDEVMELRAEHADLKAKIRNTACCSNRNCPNHLYHLRRRRRHGSNHHDATTETALIAPSLMDCPCGQVRYCSKSCQVADWKKHKSTCTAVRKKKTNLA